jgi:hypothetical protein
MNTPLLFWKNRQINAGIHTIRQISRAFLKHIMKCGRIINKTDCLGRAGSILEILSISLTFSGVEVNNLTIVPT